MNKVFLLRPEEDWIVDRMVSEWYEDNADISVDDPKDADVIWLLANWCYKKFDLNFLNTKKVITTIHHIVEEKFDQVKYKDFMHRDAVTDVYHVPNLHTEAFIKKLTNKPIVMIPYWANQKIWFQTDTKEKLRKKYNLPNSYLVGSFQRDTEGYDLKTPKMEKGPDLFINAIEKYWKDNKEIHVVLAGWRRQYVMARLNSIGISYTYLDRPSQHVVNELYQTLDLYPITSRYEGGPQALIECGLLKIPVVSRNVGMANFLLPKKSISDDVTKTVPTIPDIENLKLPQGYEKYRILIEKL